MFQFGLRNDVPVWPNCRKKKKRHSDLFRFGMGGIGKIYLAELAPLNPIRLQLAVDFSTFYYDVLKSLQMTCTLVDQAINDATRDMAAQLSIIQVLHDKVDSWRSELRSDET
ncbi:14-3-3-like protein GF14-12 isoform X3 [Zingiber officinale]|uniref:14-3-3-like protein GF14-12 isoform X3 n=1 Tax=Zingiber officinale TaxID=94328 RepID=UPI001C4B7D2D|nr:14-3-3-like protein GF14-12 isoform X3 [Zingiber officinale]